MQDSCVQKKKKRRSKPRSIYCPIHGCYLDSVSQKYHLFAAQSAQLQVRGMSRTTAQMVINAHTTVSIQGEWLEAFWCDCCQNTTWYYVRKTGDRVYELSLASDELWQSVGGGDSSQWQSLGRGIYPSSSSNARVSRIKGI